MNKNKLLTFALSLMILFSLFASISVFGQQEPGPATDTIIFRRVAQELAPAAILAGDIDYYIYQLDTSQGIALRENEEVELYYAPASIRNLDINPAPDPTGKLNPMAIDEIRFALNYMVDRDFVVNQLLDGFAAPMVCFLSSYDPDFVVIYDIVAKYEFKYDLTIADSIITESMNAAGATKEEGKWMYDGEPVTIKFVIRIEDERREIGDHVASSLEAVGFTVDRQYMGFGQAIPVIYGSDPADQEWHLYTAGWGKSVPDKYDASSINQFGAPWYTWIPGYQEEGFWQYENEELDDLGKKIYLGNYSSQAERDALYKEMTEKVILSATRTFIATTLDIYGARASVEGLTEDVGTGVRSPFNAREARIAGEDTLSVGNLWVWTEGTVWNPIAGHNDVYSVDILRNIYDPFLWRHPFAGLPMPFRADYDVVTAGPDGKLAVPADAFLWDNETDTWTEVGPGVEAKTKVTYDMSNWIGTNFHHGETIGWEDILYPLSQFYEIAYDSEKSSLESYTAAVLQEELPLYKGWKIDGENLIVYIDYWHFDENYIAEFANPFDENQPQGHWPWEVCAAMDKVVFEDQTAAYSETAGTAFGVPWLSLVLEDHADMVADALQTLKSENFVPSNVFTAAGTSYVTDAEAQDRYDAAISWFNDKKHLVISDGSYYMNDFDAEANFAELKAFRDSTYPMSVGDWFYGRASPPEIASLGIPTVVPGSAASLVIDLVGLPPLGVKYLIRDPITAEIVDIGDAEGITASRFVISLSSDFTLDLDPGLYELTLAAYSEHVALVSTEKAFIDVLSLGTVEKGLEQLGEQLTGELSSMKEDLSSQVNAMNTNLADRVDQASTEVSDAVKTMASSQTTIMAIAGIAAVLVLVNIFLSQRKS